MVKISKMILFESEAYFMRIFFSVLNFDKFGLKLSGLMN